MICCMLMGLGNRMGIFSRITFPKVVEVISKKNILRLQIYIYLGGDAVIANVQDGSGTDNANFLSPEDGEPGVLNMFTFNTSDNQRDASLDTQVAIHELSHGLSNRLTGGPQAANCMDSGEAGGLGEGISDFVAIVLTMPKGKTRDDDIAIGAYAQNSDKGVRSRKYSTSLKRNGIYFIRFYILTILFLIFYSDYGQG